MSDMESDDYEEGMETMIMRMMTSSPKGAAQGKPKGNGVKPKGGGVGGSRGGEGKGSEKKRKVQDTLDSDLSSADDGGYSRKGKQQRTKKGGSAGDKKSGGRGGAFSGRGGAGRKVDEDDLFSDDDENDHGMLSLDASPGGNDGIDSIKIGDCAAEPPCTDLAPTLKPHCMPFCRSPFPAQKLALASATATALIYRAVQKPDPLRFMRVRGQTSVASGLRARIRRRPASTSARRTSRRSSQRSKSG